MKQLSIIILFLSLSFTKVYSQATISPDQNTEFCPNVNQTFTVSGIPGTISYVINYLSNCTVVSGASTSTSPFTFVGRFGDFNTKQTFRVGYKENGVDKTQDFPFKNIKSLYFNTPFSPSCPVIQPNVSSIIAPRCQIINAAISFPNIKWSTFGESPDYCFGTISTYEYLLPAGWKLGTRLSNGTTWLPANNSVTVTSDLSTGDGAFIQIRAANNCGVGLANGQTPIAISISRPAPQLSISQGDVICSGTFDYSVNGLPPGATVCWSISSSVATIPSSPYCGNTVTVTKTGTGVATLTATVTDCSQTYPAINKNITLGLPIPFITAQKTSAIGEPTDYLFTATNFAGTVYNWYANTTLVSGEPYNTLQYYFPCNVTKAIKCSITNTCGSSAFSNSISKTGECVRAGAFTVSPNPATNDVTIASNSGKTETLDNKYIQEISIYDMHGNLKKYQKFKSLKSVTINIADLKNGNYYIEISDGINKEKQQFLIQK